MWFGLLGTLQVRIEDREVSVPAAKQRVLLAALLLQPGRAVSTARLSELLWDGEPPGQAAVTLRNYMRRLRRALSPPEHPPEQTTIIITTSNGYKIDVAVGQIDIAQFDDQVRLGIAAAQSGDWQRAAGLLDPALALWRGSPLADIPCQALHLAETPRLEEQRLQAIQWHIEARLQLGQHHAVTPQLQSLTAEHPLRDPFHGQLMVALYRSGRQAEALAAYQSARSIVVSELGLEPGPDLRLLHQRILSGDRELLAAASGGAGQQARSDLALAATPAAPKMSVPVAGQTRQVPVPRQLPAPVPGFTGRDTELAELNVLLGTMVATPPAMLITAICGTAGVGKTALAVQWAHQAAEQFPDGQLYINLRGYDPGEPLPASGALARILRDLGVPGPDIPADEEECAARYRSLLAGRRLLVLLDNARSAEQVRPLLPAAPGCAAVVTSRDALVGLVSREGVRRLDLDLLLLADAVSLLRTLIGGRVDAEPEAAAMLAKCCCRLPLALRVAAELAAARSPVTLASLVTELADQQRRLDLLDAGGDQRAAVRAVFSWSYRNLDPGAARAFRLLGLHPGPDLDAYAAAALTDTNPTEASRLLEQLRRAYLIQPAGPGRYGMHDLLRAYAAEQAKDDADCGQAAMARLLDYYLHAAVAASNALFPAERGRLARIEPPVVTSPPATGHPATARTWLDVERGNLVRLVAYAAENNWPWHATGLAAASSRYLDVTGYYADATAVHSHARTAATHARSPAAEATALTDLGNVHWRQGRHEEAAGCFRLAITLSRQIADQACEARALTSLGLVDLRQGRHQQAAGHFRQALALCRLVGDQPGQARALGNLGVLGLRQGRYRQAASHLQQALAIHRRTGNQTGEANALGNLGDIALRLGSYRRAAHHFQQALALHRQIGNPTIGAYALTNLGIVAHRLGRFQQATDYHEQALLLFRQTGDRSGEAGALNGLGEASLATGQPDHARIQHTIALDLAAQIGEVEKQARAHVGLARACDAAHDPDLARHHWRQALDLYTEVGAPEADQIRADLAGTKMPGLCERDEGSVP